MGNDWILDVLADLRAFACANDMAHLVVQLDQAVMIASAEIASKRTAANWPMDPSLPRDIYRSE